MSFLSLLRDCLQTVSSVSTPVKSRPRVAPRLELLEDRTVLSTTSVQANGVLTITGDKLDNNVTIVQNDQLNTFKVYEDVGGQKVLLGSYISKDVGQLNVDLGDGNDQLTYELDFAAGNAFNKNATINLGNGNDGFYLWGGLNPTGSSAGRVRGNLDFKVYGGSGNDVLTTAFPNKVGGRLNLLLDAGAGDDSVFASLGFSGGTGGISRGAQVAFDLRGGVGNDVFDCQVGDLHNDWAINAPIAANSALTVLMDGGDGMDTMNFEYNGKVDGRLNLHMNGGADSDWVFAQPKLLAGSTGSFTGTVYGGAGNDELGFNLIDTSGGMARVFGFLDGGQNDVDTALRISGNVLAVNVP